MDRGAIKHLSRRKKLYRWIEELSSSYQDCDKKKLKSSIDSLAVERCRGAVEIALKTNFQEEKNINMNAIKHATQPRIQPTF